MNKTELAAYTREKGLYVEQIRAWKDACINANGGVARETAGLNKELKASEKEREKLEKEMQYKERALAGTDALLTLAKSPRDLGGSRGRMISAPDREEIIILVDETVAAGAKCSSDL